MKCEKEIAIDEKQRLKVCINYQAVEKIFAFACAMHGEDNMRSPLTWVYNLSSLRRIDEVVRSGGEYILLKRGEDAVGLVCLSFPVSYRPLDNPRRTLTIDEWEIGSLLIHKECRGEGFSKILFKLAKDRLKETKGVDRAYVVVTGTFDRQKPGEPRDLSRPAITLCKKNSGRLIGYGKDSFGPVFELDIS